MLIRKGALKPSDDSPFANEVFDPEGKFRSLSFGILKADRTFSD